MSVNENIRNGNVVAMESKGEGALGSIFWYSIHSEVEVTREDLSKLFDNIGIDHSWLPNEIRPSDAFRRTTTEIQKKKVPTKNPNILQNFLTREVYADTKTVQRNIVVEEVDQSGKRLNYRVDAAIIELDKKNGTFKVIAKDSEELAKELAHQSKHKFERYMRFYSSQQLRVMVSKYLSSLAPTAVRPNGGVYFVPASFTNELKMLQQLCTDLHSEGVVIPLYDTSDNRDMVLKKLENEFMQALARCQELENMDVPKKKIQDAIEDAKRVANTYKNYRDNISLHVESLEDQLDDLRASAMALTNKYVNRK
ncbi:phage protein [Gracilibacillus boraciitolerans JCM 21714]|uniref:Phage protein n=1 Tax=Gracilibacillus boraciitolerans JCM 21714 TaxID=1298598 RepID=W4VIJ5_9BACI|nr:DUF6744 family protein [Gracilibacillus boraciitolerans]GAE93032.1 phage protein [Gracilibacillus boraciitolerans JCM 21714]